MKVLEVVADRIAVNREVAVLGRSVDEGEAVEQVGRAEPDELGRRGVDGVPDLAEVFADYGVRAVGAHDQVEVAAQLVDGWRDPPEPEVDPRARQRSPEAA